MFELQIYPDGEVPVSEQLFEQIQFAIASRHYTPGQRLPSTRQLAQRLKIHRNTVSKVYRLLEASGLVELKKGSGIYVKAQEQYPNLSHSNTYPQVQQIISRTIEELLKQGCSLAQIKNIFLEAINWRLLCLETIIVTIPEKDIETGELIVTELTEIFQKKINLISLENLANYLSKTELATVITTHYFIQEIYQIIQNKSIYLMPIEIYNYEQELDMIKDLPCGTYLGLVSISKGILEVAEKIIYTLRGEDIIIITAQTKDTNKLIRLVKSCQVIISDRPSISHVNKIIEYIKNDLIRFPRLIWIDNYVNLNSLELLQNQLLFNFSKY